VTTNPGTIACQACAAPLDPESTSRIQDSLTCRFCGAWNRVAGAKPLPPPRIPLDRPPRIRVADDGRATRWTRVWWSPAAFVLLVFALFWNALVVVVFAAFQRSSAPLLFRMFPLIHLGVGLFLFYLSIAALLNRTVLEVDADRTLSVRHGPLPWPGRVTLDSGDVTQVYVVENVRTGERSRGTVTELRAIRRGGTRVKLLGLSGLTTEEALYLEQELERRLGLRDVPVLGEVAREG
jgi:hypothetical protein